MIDHPISELGYVFLGLSLAILITYPVYSGSYVAFELGIEIWLFFGGMILIAIGIVIRWARSGKNQKGPERTMLSKSSTINRHRLRLGKHAGLPLWRQGPSLSGIASTWTTARWPGQPHG
jgi:hypothetical protein